MSWLLRQVEGFVLAVLLAVLLSVPTVRAQTLNSDGSLHWGITSSGPSTSQVVGTSLVIAAVASGLVLTLTPPGAIAGAGAATVALTGRAFTLAGQYVGPIAAGMLRQAAAKGPLTGAMLALAAALGSDAVYDANSNSFNSVNTVNKPNGSTIDYTFTGWWGYNDYGVCKQASPCDAGTAGQAALDGYFGANKWVLYSITVNPSDPTKKTAVIAGRRVSDGVVQTNLTSISRATSYTDPPATYVPSTDAQLSSAAQAPAALAKVWDAGGCPQRVTTFRDTLSADDPCAKIIGSPAGQWTPVSVPNGGSISLPSTTQTVTDSTGKVAQTITTTPTAQVKPNTDQATMAASPVIVTPGSVVKTVTNNADGSQTTTTTTTTSPSTSTDQPQDGTAAFNAGTQDLYTKKSRTWAQVLGDFQTAVKAAPWYQAATGFFNVSISGGACPHWTVPASKWTPALDAGVYVCSSSMMTLYQAGGIIVMIVAAWAAFRIAFL
ncbi:hypothetical protein [Cupriavidus metallidurans]|uniref:hypothetical protein n=1 Tax=Cupriavidus metallidurans TaxID=119219 RepID=UPI0004933683|nr:hypothetical protein [Cupriavidus metallidurans]MDE4919810.1 hypothetical protein [Cupriavidus metallidurans]